MTKNEELLRSTLSNLLDEYRQYTDNACHCEDYEECSEEEEDCICPFCYAENVLKKTK